VHVIIFVVNVLLFKNCRTDKTVAGVCKALHVLTLQFNLLVQMQNVHKYKEVSSFFVHDMLTVTEVV